MSKKLAGWAVSSQSPEQVSNRIKGVILASSSIIIFLVGKVFGITLTANDMVSLATIISGVGGAVWAVYGGVLALITKIAEIKE